MSLNIHCLEIKKCPRSLSCICPCMRASNHQHHPSRTADDSPDSVRFELMESALMTVSKMSQDADTTEVVSIMLDETASLICMSSPNSIHDDLHIKATHHTRQLDRIFPPMLSLIVKALVNQTVESSRRRQVTISVPKRGTFVLTCWPLLEASGAVGCALQIKRRMLTVSELAKFIK